MNARWCDLPEDSNHSIRDLSAGYARRPKIALDKTAITRTFNAYISSYTPIFAEV